MAAEPSRGSAIRHSVLRGTLANYAARFIGVGIWFFITPFALRVLDEAGYGLWVLAAVFIGYGSLLDFGIAGAVTKYVAEYQARGEEHQIGRLSATALLIYSGLGLVVALVTLAAAPVASRLITTGDGNQATTSAYILLTGLTIAVTLPCLTVQAVLNGLQRYDLVSLSSALGNLFSASATVLVLLTGGGLIGAVAINLPTTLLMQTVNVWCLRRAAPRLHFGWRGANRSMARLLLSYSWSLLIGRVAKRVKSKTDELEIAAFLPVSAVAPYAIARRLAELAQNLTDQFLRVLLPVASELHADDDKVRLRALYTVGTRLSLAMYVPIACTLVLLARPILAVWVRPEYADYAYLVTLLALAGLVDTSQWPASNILQGMARHRPVMLAAFASALTNLALSIALVRPLGLAGIALGTLVPTLIENLLFVLPYSLRVIGIRPADGLREAFLPALAPAVPMGLILYALERTTNLESWPALVLAAGTGGLVYLAGYLIASTGTPERRLCLNVALSTLRLTEARFRRS